MWSYWADFMDVVTEEDTEGEMEVNDLLWQRLKAVAGKKKQPIKMR